MPNFELMPIGVFAQRSGLTSSALRVYADPGLLRPADVDPVTGTGHINRFGEYSTHELGIQPEAYDPKLDVDFTPLREQDLTTASFGQAV